MTLSNWSDRPESVEAHKDGPRRGENDARREDASRRWCSCRCSARRAAKVERSAGSRAASERSPQARLEEAVGLAAAIDLDVKASGLVPVPNPRPATFFGSGKVEEIAGLMRAEDAELVIVDIR